MTILGVLHHGITVSDIDVAVDWYTRVLGLELVHRQRQENAYTPVLVGVPTAVLEVAQLRIPNGLGRVSTHDIELIQYVQAGHQAPATAVNQVGVAHLGFLVDDVEALAARAGEAGAVLRNPPVGITEGANSGGAACYVHDPDGNTLEFLQPSPARLAAISSMIGSVDRG
ncbi:VOC family protein [Actinomadura sp. B10D3]|uniref:VOC family protein n=1 Tax=Actinomadura sp. B10D3 TaxID=3153557 RepID=UPI00325CDC9F